MNPIIVVESLRFRYPRQSVDTICGISFAIEAGEIFGFLGPSGSGKSTIQNLLTGLLKNYSGQLEILHQDAGKWRHELYRHIGVGFELPNHFSKLTGLENLQLFAAFHGKPDADSQARSPLELLQLVDLADCANQRVSDYSKGMKMRLNFARALLNDPDLLFLDEPTAGLDPVTARMIKNIILDLKREGKTIFLTTHNMHDADELCDRVAFIVEGELKLIGAPTALKVQHGQKIVEVKTVADGGRNASKSYEFALDSLATDKEFLDLLQRQTIESIHSKEATLEEVFIRTTGLQLT